jgi:hypothetical protein
MPSLRKRVSWNGKVVRIIPDRVGRTFFSQTEADYVVALVNAPSQEVEEELRSLVRRMLGYLPRSEVTDFVHSIRDDVEDIRREAVRLGCGEEP